MTAAGVGSLLICQRQLDALSRASARHQLALDAARGRDVARGLSPVDHQCPDRSGVKRGMAWLGANFAPSNPSDLRASRLTTCSTASSESAPWPSGRRSAGSTGSRKGATSSARRKSADGSWTGQHGIEMNTVWAILFLTKSTAKTIQQDHDQAKLGAGTLLGGRELPKDLTSMTVAGGRVVSRPMNGAIEGMLAVLEDPRAEQADAAVAGWSSAITYEGPGVLRPFKVRFRKMLSDRDVGRAPGRRLGAGPYRRSRRHSALDRCAGRRRTKTKRWWRRPGWASSFLSRKIDGLGPAEPLDARRAQGGRAEVARVVSRPSARSTWTIRTKSSRPDAAARGRRRPRHRRRSRSRSR